VEEREKILFYSRKNKATFEFSHTRCLRAQDYLEKEPLTHVD